MRKKLGADGSAESEEECETQREAGEREGDDAMFDGPCGGNAIARGKPRHHGLSHSVAPLGKSRLERTGARRREKMSAPSRAKLTIHAIGRKRRPSTACRVKIGR